jgi:tellurite resistance protein TerC
MQNVSGVVWLLTIAGILGLLLFDFFFHVRRAHIPSIGEAARWTGLYMSIALLFGAGIWCSAARRWAPSTSPAM